MAKLTPLQEYDQWLDNYDILLEQLRAAYRFKNQAKIPELHKRILQTQMQIAMSAKALKEIGNAHARNVISAPISADVKVRKHTPVNLKSIDGDGVE